MNAQLTISFETASPINKVQLTGQNKFVYDTLNYRTLNRIEAIGMGITALNSRISDLRNRSGIIIHDRFITTKGGSKVKEYSLKPFLNK